MNVKKIQLPSFTTLCKKMKSGKNIFERVLVEYNPGKAGRTEFHRAVIAITSEFAALLAVVPVDKPDFAAFDFKSSDTSFTYGATGIENTWDGKAVIEATAQTDFFTPFVAGGEFNFHC